MRRKTKVKLKRKNRWLLLATSLAMLLPLDMAAQQDGSHGLFARGGSHDDVGVSRGFMNQGFRDIQSQMTNQTFGGTQESVTNQTFGAPLGSGFFVLFAASAGYATLKKKNNKSNRKN